MALTLRAPPAGRRARAPDHNARAHLLDAATALIAERGVANTTLAQIAAAGSVTSAMVHYWFRTRERLLDAVVEERVARAFRIVWDPAQPADAEPLAQTLGIVRRMFDVNDQMPWLASLWAGEQDLPGIPLADAVHPADQEDLTWTTTPPSCKSSARAPYRPPARSRC